MESEPQWYRALQHRTHRQKEWSLQYFADFVSYGAHSSLKPVVRLRWKCWLRCYFFPWNGNLWKMSLLNTPQSPQALLERVLGTAGLHLDTSNHILWQLPPWQARLIPDSRIPSEILRTSSVTSDLATAMQDSCRLLGPLRASTNNNWDWCHFHVVQWKVV